MTRFASTLPAVSAGARALRVEGATIASVEARGKHLLLRFATAPPAVLHTHMGMTGSWHLYRPGSRWRTPPHLARVVVETAEVVAVCFTPRTVEWLRASREGSHPVLAGLGPDIVAPHFDAAAAKARIRERANATIGETLLDQRAVAGIGNIYRCEALFASRVDPFAPVDALADETIDRVLAVARRLMRRALLDGPRGHQVYRRSGRPCRRCGATIRMRRHGTPPRSLYWCAGCQGGSSPRET